MFYRLSPLRKDEPPHSRPNRIITMCRRGRHEVCLWTHFQSLLQGLDGGQVGQPRTITIRAANLQPPSRVATQMQRGFVSPCPCYLSCTRSRISCLRSRSGQSRSGFPVRVSNVGHSPTTHPGLPDPPIQDLQFSINSFKLLILSFFLSLYFFLYHL